MFHRGDPAPAPARHQPAWFPHDIIENIEVMTDQDTDHPPWPLPPAQRANSRPSTPSSSDTARPSPSRPWPAGSSCPRSHPVPTAA